MKGINLKPCPFCGGEANLHSSFEFSYVSCRKCGIQTPVRLSDVEACNKWNKRSSWHTGTPTEEGWYLIQTKRVDVDTGRYIFKVGNLSDVLWFQNEGYKELSCYGIVAWQKIELYKENEDGHID